MNVTEAFNLLMQGKHVKRKTKPFKTYTSTCSFSSLTLEDLSADDWEECIARTTQKLAEALKKYHKPSYENGWRIQENMETNKPRTSEFDLEKALAGHPVITRIGEKVTKLHYFNDERLDKFEQLIGIVDDEKVTTSWSKDGIYCQDEESSYDLFMLNETQEKQKVWVVISLSVKTNNSYFCTNAFFTKARALDWVEDNDNPNDFVIKEIEI